MGSCAVTHDFHSDSMFSWSPAACHAASSKVGCTLSLADGTRPDWRRTRMNMFSRGARRANVLMKWLGLELELTTTGLARKATSASS